MRHPLLRPDGPPVDPPEAWDPDPCEGSGILTEHGQWMTCPVCGIDTDIEPYTDPKTGEPVGWRLIDHTGEEQ